MERREEKQEEEEEIRWSRHGGRRREEVAYGDTRDTGGPMSCQPGPAIAARIYGITPTAAATGRLRALRCRGTLGGPRYEPFAIT